MATKALTVLAVLAGGCTAANMTEKHLYVHATGEDLGLSLGGTVAKSKKYGGAIDFANTATVLLIPTMVDCTMGNGVIAVDGRENEERFLLPNGILVEPSIPRGAVPFEATAVWARLDTVTTVCANFSPMTVHGEYFHWIVDTFGNATIVQRYSADELEIVP